MGADPAEAGLRFNQAQNVLSENQDAKQLFSKNRGLNQLLGDFAFIVNKWLRMSGYPFAKDFKFRFNALTTEDKGFEADLVKKKIETYMEVNEIRKEMGLPPLENGNIILNSVYLQAKQAAEMQQQGEGGEDGSGFEGEGDDSDFSGFSEDDIDGAVDEALQGMEKAIRLI